MTVIDFLSIGETLKTLVMSGLIGSTTLALIGVVLWNYVKGVAR